MAENPALLSSPPPLGADAAGGSGGAPIGYAQGLPAAPPLEKITHPTTEAAKISLYCLRDDLYSPAPGTALQGNKVRKLEPVLRAALSAKHRPLLVSFGGAYSNHLSALATAGRVYDLQTLIYVRGKEVDNPLLRQAEEEGATLIRISRSEYRRKTDAEWLAVRRRELAVQFSLPEDLVWLIPEGGTSPEAVTSVGRLFGELVDQLGCPPDFVCVGAGTGGTAAGLIAAANPTTHVEVYPALKGNWMMDEIRTLLPANTPENWTCIYGYHFGGYGKFPPEWIVPTDGLAKRAFLQDGLPPLEPIYTAKLFAGVLDRIASGVYPKDSTVVVVHTGGVY